LKLLIQLFKLRGVTPYRAATCSGAIFKAKALMAVRRLWVRLEGAALAATSSSAREQFSRWGASPLGTNPGKHIFHKMSRKFFQVLYRKNLLAIAINAIN
jgi:hypothetical protein